MTAKKNPEEVANSRFQIICPLLQINASSREGRIQFANTVRQLASLNKVSARTIRRWYKKYKAKGFMNLTNKTRVIRTETRLIPQFDELMLRAKSARLTDPYISVNCIITGLESAYPEIKGLLKRSTVQKYLEKMHVTRRELVICGKLDGRPIYGRYLKKSRLSMVMSDLKDSPHGMVIDDMYGRNITAYLQTFTDAYSGRVLDFDIRIVEDDSIVLASLRRTVLRYGEIDTLLFDNGGNYKSKDIRMACRRLNIKIIYCSPDHPEGKGKQERFYGIAEQIYKQFEARKNIPLKVFCVLVEEWIKIYNDRPLPHRGSKSPNQLFDEDISRKLIPLPIEYINSAFVKTEYRKIHKDGTVSVNGIIFQIPVQYAKMYKKVLIRFSTYDNYDASLALDSGELVPLKEQVIDEDIDWSAKSAIKERNDLPEEPDTIYLEYVARSRAKRLGTYKDEESFQKEYKAMFNTPSASEGQSDAQDKSKTKKAKKASQPSPYSIADEKGDDK